MIDIRKILESDWLESFAIALLLNSIVILVLSIVTISRQESKSNVLIINSFQEEIETQDFLEPIEDITVFDREISIAKPPSESALSVSQNLDITSISIDQNVLDINSEILPSAIPNTIEDINTKISIGNSINHDTNIGGVLDRLTSEILYNADRRDLEVIWLLDASISLSKQRADIRDRFIKINNELVNSTSSLIKHSIISFGSSYKLMNPEPTNDIKVLVSAIDSIVIDESGVENTFTTVEQLCRKQKNNNVIIILFTDEVGDDITVLDKACFEARKKGIIIYAVGPPAPFGSEKIQFKYVDPDPKYDQSEKWVEINQGPETLFKMTLNLRSLDIDNTGIDSGFGPYGLSKLCDSTGGMYFSVHPNRNGNMVSKKQIAPLSSYITVFFDNTIMAKYSPDYRSVALQKKDNETNQIKNALLKACAIPLDIIYDQRMFFTAINEGDFVEQLGEAQKFSARLEPKIDEIYTILKSVEPYSKNLAEKRWLASYNLAMGRILATKCRIESYNNMLAEAKSGLKKTDPKTNAWQIERDKTSGIKTSQIQKSFQLAVKYLDSVIYDYPNTPWAYVAKSELNTPMGYKWIEQYKEPPKSMNSGPNNNNNTPPKDDIKKKIEYKPQRNTSKI